MVNVLGIVLLSKGRQPSEQGSPGWNDSGNPWHFRQRKVDTGSKRQEEVDKLFPTTYTFVKSGNTGLTRSIFPLMLEELLSREVRPAFTGTPLKQWL
jgi:hypothetical protein